MRITLGLMLMLMEMLLLVPTVALTLGSIRMCGDIRCDQPTHFRASLLFALTVATIGLFLLADIIRRLVSL